MDINDRIKELSGLTEYGSSAAEALSQTSQAQAYGRREKEMTKGTARAREVYGAQIKDYISKLAKKVGIPMARAIVFDSLKEVVSELKSPEEPVV